MKVRLHPNNKENKLTFFLYRVVWATASTPFLIALVHRWCSTTWLGTGSTLLSSVSVGRFESSSVMAREPVIGARSGREGGGRCTGVDIAGMRGLTYPQTGASVGGVRWGDWWPVGVALPELFCGVVEPLAAVCVPAVLFKVPPDELVEAEPDAPSGCCA